MLKGSIVALITPFKNNEIDTDAMGALIERHVAAGTDAILVAGTTGESATWTSEEYTRCVKFVVDTVNRRLPVMAGTGTQSTRTTVERTQLAKELGADLALVVTPYYNKPTQAGLFEHFRMVATEGGLPVVLYNVPGRTGVNMLPETVLKLHDVPGIIAVKEASGSVAQSAWILRGARKDFALYSGEDKLNYPLIALGAVGAISVVANVVPELFAQSIHAALEGNREQALALYHRLLPISEGLFLETSPAPAKACMQALGMIPRDDVRLPLVGVGESTRVRLLEILRELGLSPVS